MLKIADIRLLDVEIIKDGKVVYKGMVDDAPEELRDCEYKKIEGAYPVIIEI